MPSRAASLRPISAMTSRVTATSVVSAVRLAEARRRAVLFFDLALEARGTIGVDRARHPGRRRATAGAGAAAAAGAGATAAAGAAAAAAITAVRFAERRRRAVLFLDLALEAGRAIGIDRAVHLDHGAVGRRGPVVVAAGRAGDDAKRNDERMKDASCVRHEDEVALAFESRQFRSLSLLRSS